MSRIKKKRARGWRKMLFVNVRKAHSNAECEEDVHIDLPEECACPEGWCAKMVHWLYQTSRRSVGETICCQIRGGWV